MKRLWIAMMLFAACCFSTTSLAQTKGYVKSLRQVVELGVENPAESLMSGGVRASMVRAVAMAGVSEDNAEKIVERYTSKQMAIDVCDATSKYIEPNLSKETLDGVLQLVKSQPDLKKRLKKGERLEDITDSPLAQELAKGLAQSKEALEANSGAISKELVQSFVRWLSTSK